jgi:enoyl-CoA hydratase
MKLISHFHLYPPFQGYFFLLHLKGKQKEEKQKQKKGEMLRRVAPRLCAAPAKLVKQENFVVTSNASVAVVTLQSPASRNAMTVAMGDQFKAIMEQLAAEASSGSTLRAVVLTGDGTDFSAGGDVNFLRARIKDNHEGNVRAMRAFYDSFLSLRRVGVPVVAGINGNAIGAGFCVALACDIRVVAADAKLAINFTRLGIHPGMGATYFIPRLVGASVASRIILTGDMFSGTEAVRLGLVSAAYPTADNVRQEAFSLAESIAKASPIAVRETLKTLRGDDTTGLPAALQREAEAQAACYAEGKDLAEALTALKEKRAPSFV